MSQVVDPESSNIYAMIGALKEAGISNDSRVFQALLSLFTEIRTLEGLAQEAHDRSAYWHARAMEAEGKLRRLTRES